MATEQKRKDFAASIEATLLEQALLDAAVIEQLKLKIPIRAGLDRLQELV